MCFLLGFLHVKQTPFNTYAIKKFKTWGTHYQTSPRTSPIINRTLGFPGPAVFLVPAQSVPAPVKLLGLAGVQQQSELARLPKHFYLPGVLNEDTSSATERKEQLTATGRL